MGPRFINKSSATYPLPRDVAEVWKRSRRMILPRIVLPILVGTLSITACTRDDASVEDLVARHMVGEALLAAHFVAAAERAGMGPNEINKALRDVADKSAIDEFWITDSTGDVYLTNTGVDFKFSADTTAEPQASAFWPLIEGKQAVVIQQARVREIDNRVFKYVAVAGVDKPRIVQVGVSAENLTGRR
jgi:hypothetical protein